MDTFEGGWFYDSVLRQHLCDRHTESNLRIGASYEAKFCRYKVVVKEWTHLSAQELGAGPQSASWAPRFFAAPSVIEQVVCRTILAGDKYQKR